MTSRELLNANGPGPSPATPPESHSDAPGKPQRRVSNREWFRRQAERMPAIPVQQRAPWRRIWRSRRHPGWQRSLTMIAGGLAATAGLLLGANGSGPAVALDGGGYHVDGIVLAPQGNGHYGGDAALVIRSIPGGGESAGASATLDGRHMVGSCTLAADRASEQCRFLVGSRQLTARDAWSSQGWQRRYHDGTTLTISASSPIPVPFALGE